MECDLTAKLFRIVRADYFVGLEDEVHALLALGADPNFCMPDCVFSTHTCAAMKGIPRLFHVFLECERCDFNIKGQEANSTFYWLLQWGSSFISEDICLAVYQRMTIADHPTTFLLEAAISYKRYGVARALILAHHGFNYRLDYFHQLAMNKSKESIDLARLLYDEGYRKTESIGSIAGNGWAAHTALETAAYYDNTDMVDFLAPFAVITLRAIYYLACSGSSEQFIRLINLCTLRELEIPWNLRSPTVHPRMVAVMRHIAGQPALSAAMAQKQDLDSTVPHHDLHGSLVDKGVKKAPMHLYNELLVMALLQQGEVPDESIRGVSTLPCVMHPWTPRLTPYYFPIIFKERAFVLLLAIEMTDTSMLPIEMCHVIIGYISRVPDETFIDPAKFPAMWSFHPIRGSD